MESADRSAYLNRVVRTGAVLRSGTTVIGNSDPAQLLFLNGARVVAVSGRRGAGPGEFSRLDDIFATDHAVHAYDTRRQRVTIYNHAGMHLRDVHIVTTGSPVFAGAFDASGRMMTRPFGTESDTARIYTVWDSAGGVPGTIQGPGQYAERSLRAFSPTRHTTLHAAGYCPDTVLLPTGSDGDATPEAP